MPEKELHYLALNGALIAGLVVGEVSTLKAQPAESQINTPAPHTLFIPTVRRNSSILTSAEVSTPSPTLAPTLTYTPTFTRTPTRTPEPTETLVPTNTSTPTPTETPTPTSTETPTPTLTPTPQPTFTPLPVWTPNFNSNEDVAQEWDLVLAKCHSITTPGILDMECESQGLTSKQKWNKNYDITLKGSVQAWNSRPAKGYPPYWGGLTLFDQQTIEIGGELIDDSRYAELAVQSQVARDIDTDSVISLTDERRPYPAWGVLEELLTIVPQTWQNFKIVYKAAENMYHYYINDNSDPVFTIEARMVDDPNIFFLCVGLGKGAVGPSTDARARCRFKKLIVEGVPIPSIN